MNIMKSSWKTSLAGVASILGGLLTLIHMAQGGAIDTGAVTAGLTAIASGVGLIFARDHSVSDEEAGTTPGQKTAVQAMASGVANKAGLAAVLAFGLAAGVTGCAKLAAGADPLVVRTEQTETLAYNTFDTFLKLDDTAMANAGVSNAWAKGAHPFAAYLRQPVGSGTNAVPFGIAAILSVDQIKLAYEAGASSSNALATAVNTLTATLNQAAQYASLVSTNK
jgi:hypothetical protein